MPPLQALGDRLFEHVAPSQARSGILALIAVLHLPLLTFAFVYDDSWTFVTNGFLRVPQDAWVLFTPESVARNVPDAFRPTAVLLDIVTYAAFGLDARLQHAVSIVLLLGTCSVLERWLERLGAPALERLATIAVFGTLAIGAEAVAVVSFREDLWAAWLGLGAASMATRGLQASSRKHTALTWLLAAMLSLLACTAKMSAAMIPALWFVMHRMAPWGRRSSFARQLGGTSVLGLGVLLAIAHTWMLHGDVSPYDPQSARLQVVRSGLGPVLAQSAIIHAQYVLQMLVPVGLSPEYVDRGASFASPRTMAALCMLGAMLAVALRGAWQRRWPLVTVSILGFFLLALPTSNLFAMPNMRADRFMTLPSVPVSLGLAALLLRLPLRVGRLRSRLSTHPWLVIVPLAMFVVMQGAVRQATAHTYKSDTRLWEIAAKRAPESARARAMQGELLALGLEHDMRVQPDPAILARAHEHCRTAELLDPQDALPQLCFARLAVVARQWHLAHERFEAALDRHPHRRDRILAALALIELDRPGHGSSPPTDAQSVAASRATLALALREYPYAPEVAAAAGRIHHRLGEPASARDHYRRARLLRPERWQVIVWGLELALDMGDAAAAESTWLRYEEHLRAAPTPTRTALSARLRDALSILPSRPSNSLLSAGVFPDDP